MQFLADESCDFAVVRALRAARCDVRATAGVLLLRYLATARQTMPAAVVRLVERHGQRLAGCFVVVQPGRVRISRPPDR